MGHNPSGGFSLIEMMVACLIGIVLTGGAVLVFQRSVGVADTAGQLGEVHQNARVAVNLIARDLSMAGTGIPRGGIQLPSGAGAGRSRFACDGGSCYVANGIYDDDRLYSVTPGSGKGPVIDGSQTDVVTLVYRDPDSSFDEYPLTAITPSGNQIRFDDRTDPAIGDPVNGLRIGDIMVLSNANGSAAGVVTQVTGDRALFAASDPLNFNQPSAAFGNIAALANQGTPAGQYPPTRAFRVRVITYYLEPGPDGLTTRLIRQVNAETPFPVAESIQHLRITYDIFDEVAGAATADLSDAGTTPNQIRKVNLSLLARSMRPDLVSGQFRYTPLRTSVSTRNLAFRDRYE